jgi:RNA polymerase sigma-70 factor (ECF subfamily)
MNLVKDPSVAADVQQDLWLTVFTHLPGFRWESSLKGWLYLLARRTAIKAAKRDGKRGRAGVPLSQAAESKLEAHLATSIAEWKKDDFKQRFRALRTKLPEPDQTLPTMRVDQELPFREIALALAEPDEELEGKELRTREATLMKRFQRVKQRLYQLALDDGLIHPDDPEG